MKKVIRYNICNRMNIGTEEEPEFEERLMGVEMTWSEVNEEIAKREAYRGEYIVEVVEEVSGTA